jgi:CheY-like chemotaxis protein/HPt (histidine-containing phosphotransfer) domain-containing protein
MLREFAVELKIAHDGAEAVAMAKQGAFDAIFMDMRMPVMDGLDATRAIRAAGGALAIVPIVALTANAFADDVKACRDAGMDDFVAKPIRKPILIEKLAEIAAAHLASPFSGTAERAAAYIPAGHGAAGELIDRDFIAELSGEIGAASVGEIIKVFRREARDRIAYLASLSCYRDRALIATEAHTLKGAAGAVGFAEVAALALALEAQAKTVAPADYPALVGGIETAFRKSCEAIDEGPPAA